MSKTISFEMRDEWVEAAEKAEISPEELLDRAAGLYAKKISDPEATPGEGVVSAYWREREKRPELYDTFKLLAQEVRDKFLFHSFGASAIVEGMRWDTLVRTGEPLQITNGLGAFWARELLEEDPSFVSFFEWRDSIADEVFPKAARIIALWRGKKDDDGADEPDTPEPPPSPTSPPAYDGQAYYNEHIKPFVEKNGHGDHTYG